MNKILSNSLIKLKKIEFLLYNFSLIRKKKENEFKFISRSIKS